MCAHDGVPSEDVGVVEMGEDAESVIEGNE